jgi:hypothetical protein
MSRRLIVPRTISPISDTVRCSSLIIACDAIRALFGCGDRRASFTERGQHLATPRRLSVQRRPPSARLTDC